MSEQTPLPRQLSGGRRFELHERIGVGAFGEVYLATVKSTAGFARKVALKLLHPNRFGDDDATKRIRDEARVLGRLHHPNIVTVLDLVRLETQWAVVMEYVEGADLERTLQALSRAGRTFPASAVMELVGHIADALDAAHNAEGADGRPLRVVHRDIKPANIRVTPNGEVKILDFGIARARTGREAETGSYVIGTQRYMAPERIAGRDDGPSSDVYSLAATAVELLTGTPLGRSPVLADRHADFIVAKLRTLDGHVRGDPAVVRRVAGLLHQCLSHEPLDRPRSADLATQAAALANQLKSERLRAFGRRFIPQVDPLLGRQPDRVTGVLTERTASHTPRTGEEPDTLRTEAVHVAEPQAQRRRGAWVLPMLGAAGGVVLVGGAVGLVTAAIVGVGVFVLTRANPQPVPPTVEPVEAPAAAPAEPEPQPVQVTPPPTPQPKARPRVTRAAPAPVEEAPPAIISRAQVVVDGASSLRVVCGNVAATGTSSARIMGFPAGECGVHARFGDLEVSGQTNLQAPRTVRCRQAADALACE